MNDLFKSGLESILWGFLRDYNMQTYPEDEELVNRTVEDIIKLIKKWKQQ